LCLDSGYLCISVRGMMVPEPTTIACWRGKWGRKGGQEGGSTHELVGNGSSVTKGLGDLHCSELSLRYSIEESSCRQHASNLLLFRRQELLRVTCGISELLGCRDGINSPFPGQESRDCFTFCLAHGLPLENRGRCG